MSDGALLPRAKSCCVPFQMADEVFIEIQNAIISAALASGVNMDVAGRVIQEHTTRLDAEREVVVRLCPRHSLVHSSKHTSQSTGVPPRCEA